jgi:1-aminocyclopropane-1-carboxylate deaminase/D-cysteine desulfhydrase-like pyridoxal-dependent ACC family enzyme
MADTEIQRSKAEEHAAESRTKAVVDTTTGLSEDVLESVEAGQRAAIEAVRKFVGTVDEALPEHGGVGPLGRQGVVDSALEMADRLVHTQYDFIRKVIESAGKSL